MNPEVSVVIPAYNRPGLLDKTLHAIENQSLKGGFECIIVYGGDEKKAVGSKVFSCFRSDTESPARKRNIGIGKARAPIIAFTDDDCIPDKNWLEEILVKFGGEKGIAGVEGLTYTKGRKELYSNAPVNLKGGLFPTCNLSFKAGVLQKTGGFDESYRFYREDTDVAFRAMEHGRVVFCEKAKVFHPQRRVGLMRPIETLSLLKEDVRLFKKMPEKYVKFLGKGFVLDMIKVIAAWVFLLIAAVNLDNTIIISGAIIGYCIFWVMVIWGWQAKGAQASIPEFFVFAILNLFRGILFPFYFLYYWAAVK